VDRHGLTPSRRQEWYFYHQGNEEIKLHSLSHCEERCEVIDAAIHRASEDADGAVCSVTQGPWIVTSLHPPDNKGEEKKIVFTEVHVPVLDYCPRLYRACTSSADKARP
jgi:hypothetical protein